MLLIAGTLAAQPKALAPDDPLVLRLQRSASETKALQASFTQEKSYRFMTAPLVSQGSFSFQRPDRMRWQVQGDDALVMLMSGGKVRVMEKGSELELNTVDRHLYTGIADLVNGIVSGQLLTSRKVKATYAVDGDALLVTVDPQNERMSKRFGSIEMRFGSDDLLLDELRITEADGDRTTWLFSNAVRDPALPAKTFTEF